MTDKFQVESGDIALIAGPDGELRTITPPSDEAADFELSNSQMFLVGCIVRAGIEPDFFGETVEIARSKYRDFIKHNLN